MPSGANLGWMFRKNSHKQYMCSAAGARRRQLAPSVYPYTLYPYTLYPYTLYPYTRYP